MFAGIAVNAAFVCFALPHIWQRCHASWDAALHPKNVIFLYKLITAVNHNELALDILGGVR